MCDCEAAGPRFDPEDPAPGRRRGPDASSFDGPLSMRHPALQGAHRFIAPPVTGDEERPYFAGYLTQLSVAPGDPLGVHVATRSSAPCFVDVYRVVGCADALFTPRLEHVERLGEVSPVRYPKLAGGRKLAPGEADSAGCGWPGHTVLDAVPTTWRSGIYIVQFTAEETPTGQASRLLGQDAILIVRPARGTTTAPVLYQVNTGTWAAYHMWQNQSLYMGRTIDGTRYDELRSYRASFHRPGLGLGLPNETLYTPSPPKAAYVFAFVDWLERNGVAADFCAGLDIARDAVSLEPYRALITVGHDEYWTATQRHRVQEYRANGGHTVFFGGNLAFWEIRENADGTGIECYKNSGGWKCAAAPPQPGHADEPLDPVHPSEDRSEGVVTSELWRCVVEATIPLTGVYFVARRPGGTEPVQAGSAWWWEEFGGPPRPALGFTVARPEHWVFEGTGLGEGEAFGQAIRLVGHEADGLELDYSGDRPRLSMLDGALPETTLLAYADCRDWGEVDYSAWPPQKEEGRLLSCCGFGGSVTMIHRHPADEGMLFAAPVNDWTLGLVPSIDWTLNRDLELPVRPPDPNVEAVTRNVMRFCSQDG